MSRNQLACREFMSRLLDFAIQLLEFSLRRQRSEKRILEGIELQSLRQVEYGYARSILRAFGILLVGSIVAFSSLQVPISYAEKKSSSIDPKTCNCVVIRLDDVQDYWLNKVQVRVMEVFVQGNEKLTLGEIMNYFGNDPTVVNETLKGASGGLFEYAVHGWNHVDYSSLSLEDQQSQLIMANDKMQTLYGKTSTVFLTPLNEFNNNTLTAMRNVDMNILSAATYSSYYTSNTLTPWAPEADSNGIYHAPETVSFSTFDGGIHGWASRSQLVNSIDSGIKARGWSVLTLHPQDFSNYSPDGVTALNSVNQTSLSNLYGLLQIIHSRGYSIASFHDLVSSAEPVEAAGPSVIASPPGGTYNKEKAVRLTSDAPSKIYYTTDGSTPTTLSHIYTHKISISQTTTLKFFAVDRKGHAGLVSIEQYNISGPKSDHNPDSDENTKNKG